LKENDPLKTTYGPSFDGGRLIFAPCSIL